jgi:hypothetical protein
MGSAWMCVYKALVLVSTYNTLLDVSCNQHTFVA